MHTANPSNLAQKLLEARRSLGLAQDELAERTGTSKSVISEAESGRKLPPWLVVDELTDQLEAVSQKALAQRLLYLRSKAEAPHLGGPGSLTLCIPAPVGDWHWVRRKRGQVYCPEHGEFLLGVCFNCGSEFATCDERTIYCPGCGTPIGALAESFDDGVLRSLGLLQDSYQPIAELRWRSFGSGSLENAAASSAIGPPEQRSPCDLIRQHNLTLGVESEEQLLARAQLHFRAASRIAGANSGMPFTRAELLHICKDLAPERSQASILPTDYCLGAKGQAAKNPWFLIKKKRGLYQFMGLDGNAIPIPPDTETEGEDQ